MTDAKKLGFMPAVELSYIRPENQRLIAVSIEGEQSSPSVNQAKRLRELDKEGKLNGDVIDGILSEEKKEDRGVIISTSELSKYFGKEVTPAKIKAGEKEHSGKVTGLCFETLCPKVPGPGKAGLCGDISPVAGDKKTQSEVGCQGGGTPRRLRWLALDGLPRLCYLRPRGGGISSRAAPFPWIGKGRGDRVDPAQQFSYGGFDDETTPCLYYRRMVRR